jgi:hypothetical protein
MANEIDPDLIDLCVEFAVEACQVSDLHLSTDEAIF